MSIVDNVGLIVDLPCVLLTDNVDHVNLDIVDNVNLIVGLIYIVDLVVDVVNLMLLTWSILLSTFLVVDVVNLVVDLRFRPC